MIQGTPEWFALRKTKITATDAPVIMGFSPWKTPLQLFNEKISSENNTETTPSMQRGLELESIARDFFTMKTGIEMYPEVVIKDWAMASLDGVSVLKQYLLEIKCPGKKDHDLALSGKVPDHYYPQLQHQMYVCDINKIFYLSFDGFEGPILEVERDEEFIKKMIEEELKFYECLQTKTPPKALENEYILRNDTLWEKYALEWLLIKEEMEDLEKQEKALRDEMIFISGGRNCKGAGISLSQVSRKGNIEYDKIPELKTVNLEKYRKESINTWRIGKL